MGTTESFTSLEVLLLAMLSMFGLAIGFVVFFVAYQRRLYNQQEYIRKQEGHHQQNMLRAAIDSQEKERTRIAKDLHDDIGAMLTTMKLYNEQMTADLQEEELNRIRDKVTGMAEDTIRNVRRISHDLYPVVLKNFGLEEALHDLAATLNASGRLTCELHLAGKSLILTSAQELALYRIVQELVANTLKHTEATACHLTITAETGRAHLRYYDNGPGYDPTTGEAGTGMGLQNIENRASLSGARLTYDVLPDKTVVHVLIQQK